MRRPPRLARLARPLAEVPDPARPEEAALTTTRRHMLLLLVIALVIGFLLPVQAGVNAQLRGAVGSPVVAATISFAVGTIALVLAAVVLRAPVPRPGDVAGLPWWVWTGGALGAIYIFASIILAPRLGAAALTAAIVAGQLLAALVVDHFGLVGFARQPVTPLRLLGALLLLAGVLLVQRR